MAFTNIDKEIFSKWEEYYTTSGDSYRIRFSNWASRNEDIFVKKDMENLFKKCVEYKIIKTSSIIRPNIRDQIISVDFPKFYSLYNSMKIEIKPELNLLSREMKETEEKQPEFYDKVFRCPHCKDKGQQIKQDLFKSSYDDSDYGDSSPELLEDFIGTQCSLCNKMSIWKYWKVKNLNERLILAPGRDQSPKNWVRIYPSLDPLSEIVTKNIEEKDKKITDLEISKSGFQEIYFDQIKKNKEQEEQLNIKNKELNIYKDKEEKRKKNKQQYIKISKLIIGAILLVICLCLIIFKPITLIWLNDIIGYTAGLGSPVSILSFFGINFITIKKFLKQTLKMRP